MNNTPHHTHSFKKLIYVSIFWILFFLSAPSSYAAPADYEPARLTYSDIDAHSLLDVLTNLTGKPIIRQQNLPQTSITFDSVDKLNREEAILVIESLLSINGIAITEVGEKFLKAVPAKTADTEVPRLLTGDIMQLEPGQQMFANIFDLEYLTTTEAQKLIDPFKSLNGKINIFESANALLITDALINLQRIHLLLQKLDKPAEIREDLLFMPLKHVSAKDLQSRLSTMQKGSLKTYLQGNTSIEADERTNQLIIITHPGNKPLFEEIIAKLDIDVAPLTRSEVITVSNAEAATVANLINEIITGQEQTRDKNAPNTQNPSNEPTPAVQAPAQPSTPTAPAQQALAGEGAKLQFSEHVKIVADERSNSIVAYGTPNDIEQVRDLVQKIDVLLAQVKIEVVIAEVTLSNDQVRGIDSFGLSATDFDEWRLSDLAIASSGSLASPFTLSGTLKTFSLESVFRTAKRDSNVDVLSAPTIVTTHNQEATIIVGEQRPIITSTQSNTDATSTYSSVSFENIGIELKVKPLIGANGVIQMEIEQKIEKVIDTTQIDNNEQPIIGTREAKSFLSVSDKDIIVLGGLQEVEMNQGEGRVFILGELPILGEIFRSKTNSKTVRELLLFIKPTIIRLPDDAAPMAKSDIKKLQNSEMIQESLKRWDRKTEQNKPHSFAEPLDELEEDAPEPSPKKHRGPPASRHR